ncbi:MAG: peptide deformylase [Runella slithyformis]|nr:MAG: peptide deformylase [Runella slithyformis]TAE99773.1 MAG: peptide deformylase [Runella slithyformis]TAF28434.1 MAG: peptide deformylase [Runella slithyformis]TAF47034.1 MAG: peptide deformylase [Runella slithyformis]TAF81994.1 MAG: peptide deformylase [Runella slithyformis]
MVFPIVAYGDPILRKVARDIDPHENLDLPKLVENMYETMYDSSGIGLAAPQIGMSVRLFIVDGTPLNESDDEDHEIDPTLEGFKKVFVNPQMVQQEGDKWPFEEGCLSIPGVRADVHRPESLTIKYFDLEWNEHVEQYDGMAARIIQHEYDHLEGKLFTDYLPALKKQLLKKRLNEITKGKVKVDYRMRFPK